jgi:hypothetical protein
MNRGFRQGEYATIHIGAGGKEYLIDDYGNRAYIEYFGNELMAKMALESLHKCSKCVNCKNCYRCVGCHECTNCWDCHTCIECLNCTQCSNCAQCSYCDKLESQTEALLMKGRGLMFVDNKR